jgi:hypothetical protein
MIRLHFIPVVAMLPPSSEFDETGWRSKLARQGTLKFISTRPPEAIEAMFACSAASILSASAWKPAQVFQSVVLVIL